MQQSNIVNSEPGVHASLVDEEILGDLSKVKKLSFWAGVNIVADKAAGNLIENPVFLEALEVYNVRRSFNSTESRYGIVNGADVTSLEDHRDFLVVSDEKVTHRALGLCVDDGKLTATIQVDFADGGSTRFENIRKSMMDKMGEFRLRGIVYYVNGDPEQGVLDVDIISIDYHHYSRPV